MRRLLLVFVIIAVAGCRTAPNYAYPPGEVPNGSAPSSSSHQKLPQPKAGDAASETYVVDIHT